MRAAIWMGVLVLAGSLSAPAWADDPIGRLSLGGSGGFSDYGLADLNDRIEGVGNEFLEEEHRPRLRGLDPLERGWTFWADVKLPVPLLPFFFVSGGYGVSSGKTDGPDVDNVLEVEAAQETFHLRLLYVLPFRFQEDTRLFVGGGPLLIQNQEVSVTQTNREVRDEEWTEKITYSGSGLGWQFGVAAEYMIQDRMTLCFDLAYRLADLDYDGWSADEDVEITLPPSAVAEEVDRLHYEDSYPGRLFLDWDETIEKAPPSDRDELEEFGPNRAYLVPLSKDEFGLDLSGFQIQIGFRFYFL